MPLSTGDFAKEPQMEAVVLGAAGVHPTRVSFRSGVVDGELRRAPESRSQSAA